MEYLTVKEAEKNGALLPGCNKNGKAKDGEK